MKTVNRFVSILGALLLSLAALAPAQNQPFAFANGQYGASSFNYITYIGQGTSASGAGTIYAKDAYVVTRGGLHFIPFSTLAPITVIDGSLTETVTPTTVSGCNFGAAQSPPYTCAITATFSNAHGSGAQIVSGSGGAGEAAIYAWQHGGGYVVLDNTWGIPNSSTWSPSSLTVFGSVSFVDNRPGASQAAWIPRANSLSFPAPPSPLVAGTTVVAATSPAGSYTSTNAYVVCIAYVDIMGNEGPCSTTASITPSAATGNSLTFTAPAAATGMVGYTVYISLTNGSYTFAYQAPLINGTNCTLTLVEVVTPACQITNTTYGQTGSNAVITALTVNTSPLALQLGVASVAATNYVGNSNAHTAYVYGPAQFYIPGMIMTSLPFTADTLVASTVPTVMGTIAIPTGWMNQIGRGIRVCGKWTNTDVNSTVQSVEWRWDGAGSDTAGVPVQIGLASLTAGTGTAATYVGNFCEDFFTTVSGAGVTAGTIQAGFSFLDYYLAATPGNAFPTVGGETKTASVGSLNLAGGAGFTTRLHIIHINTTGNNTPTLQSVTIQPL